MAQSFRMAPAPTRDEVGRVICGLTDDIADVRDEISHLPTEANGSVDRARSAIEEFVTESRQTRSGWTRGCAR